MKHLLLAGLASLSMGFDAVAAAPATVWRCGALSSAYSQSPCPEGRELVLVDAVRSPAEQQAAREVVQREAQALERLRQQRHERESAAQGAAGFGARSAAPVALSAKSAQPKETPPKKTPPRRHPPAADGTWRATAPVSPRAKD